MWRLHSWQVLPWSSCAWRHAAGAAAQAAAAVGGGAPAPAGFQPPLKSLMNLTTTVDSLAFSPDQQVDIASCLTIQQGCARRATPCARARQS